MIYTEEQQSKALELYHKNGSVTETVRSLGYPTRACLYRWIHNEGKPKSPRKKLTQENTMEHPRNPSLELKLEALRRCFENGETVKSVAEELGYNRTSIYIWRKRYLQGGVAALMNTHNIKPGKLPDIDEKQSFEEIESLRQQLSDLQMEVDLLRETINVIKKDPGVDWKNLKNREKVVVVDAVKNQYPLPKLLDRMHLSKSSYYYQKASLSRADRYSELRKKIHHIFEENRGRYGYRRIHAELRRNGIQVSEKVVRRIMKEEKLEVKLRKKRKYNSYQGEITPAVTNIVNREFHSDKPGEVLVSDVSEFAIPAGKVYLSPAVDCFDGFLVAWNISTHPDAELVNTMLDRVSTTLKENEKPIIHTDRGGPYRWPGWIERMEKNGYTRSMSKKGCSPDNAACEGVFGRIKNEFFYNQGWEGVPLNTFIQQLDEYLRWYNEKRIKQSLGYLSPVEYRRSLGLVC